MSLFSKDHAIIFVEIKSGDDIMQITSQIMYRGLFVHCPLHY